MRGAGLIFTLFCAFGSSPLLAHDRCYVTLANDCTGPRAYEIDLPGQATRLHQESCASLVFPCDSSAVSAWVSIHVQAKRALSGAITNATIRGSLLATASEELQAGGEFAGFAGRRLTQCFQPDGGVPQLLRAAACPALQALAPCSLGTVASDGACLLPSTLHETDPQLLLTTLRQAEAALGEAEKQINAEGVGGELEGATRAVLLPGADPVPTTPVNVPNGTSGSTEGTSGESASSTPSRSSRAGNAGKDTWVSPRLQAR